MCAKIETQYINDTNEKIISLWREYIKQTSIPDRNNCFVSPLLYSSNIYKSSILFIGLNPSLGNMRNSDKKHKDIAVRSYEDGINKVDDVSIAFADQIQKQGICISELYDFNNIDKYKNLELLTSLEECAKMKLSYFKKLELLCPKDFRYCHVDLFFERITDSKIMLNGVSTDYNKNNYLFSENLGQFSQEQKTRFSFLNAQLEISKEVIAKIEPVAIVVINARASDIIYSIVKEGKIINIDKDTGTYSWVIDKKEIPLFLNSQISGSHSMNMHEMRRLLWHIEYAINSSKAN